MDHQRQLTDAAITYVMRGLRVIALSGKAPNAAVHKHGLYDALDRATLENVNRAGLFLTAFRHEDTTGIGILTGPVYYVVDIDGEEGAVTWRDMMGDDYLPDRWVAKTGRGLHLWFADYAEWPTVKLGPSLDFKGVGGYVAAPPSAHPSGGYYEWLLPPSDIEPPWAFPDALMSALMAHKFQKERALLDRQVKRRELEGLQDDGKVYRTKSFAGIIERMKTAEPGERNNVLNWAAYTMINDGAQDPDLQVLAQAALEIGLPKYEIVRTIDSALVAYEKEGRGGD